MHRATPVLLLVIGTVLAVLLWLLLAVQLTLPPPAKRPAVVPHSGPQVAVVPTAPPVPAGSLTPLPPLLATAPAPTATLVPRSAPAVGEAARTASSPTSAPAVLPTATTSGRGRIQLPGRFAAADYKPGGEGVGYHDWTKGNAGGAYRADDVDIEPCSEGLACYDVGWIAAGEWLAYDVQVAQTDEYTFTVRVASPSRGAHFHIEVNAVDVTGPLMVPRTGNYEVWTNVVSRPVGLAAGSYELRLVADSAGFNWQSVVVSYSGAPSPG